MTKTKLRIVSLKQLRYAFALFLTVSTALFFYMLKNNSTTTYTIQEEVNYTMTFFTLIGLVMYASYNLYFSVFLKEEELEIFKQLQ